MAPFDQFDSFIHHQIFTDCIKDLYWLWPERQRCARCESSAYQKLTA
jgi:hypothetical protein